MSRPTAIMNWSGGKDSAMALHAVLDAGEYEVVALLTTVNEAYGRISMHGVRESLLDRQAEAIGLPLIKVMMPERTPMKLYDQVMRRHLEPLAADGVTHAVYGDIFLQDLRAYREERLAEVGLTAVMPLWGRPTDELAAEFVRLGFEAVTVCVDEAQLGAEFVGRDLDRDFFADLPASADPCGENGEYHSFVHAGPVFDRAIPIERGDVVRRTLGEPDSADAPVFWFADLLPADPPSARC